MHTQTITIFTWWLKALADELKVVKPPVATTWAVVLDFSSSFARRFAGDDGREKEKHHDCFLPNRRN